MTSGRAMNNERKCRVQLAGIVTKVQGGRGVNVPRV